MATRHFSRWHSLRAQLLSLRNWQLGLIKSAIYGPLLVVVAVRGLVAFPPDFHLYFSYIYSLLDLRM